MMQGITSLPGAQQAPGQAAPVSALPPQQPMTPQGMTGQLEKLPPQQLLQMFANPADKTPKWAVVTAYAKAIEQQRLMDAVQGQQAMQQGQRQAQEMPVAAQVMSQPIMARHGGIMHGYAGGGAVAFQTGASPLGLPFPNDVGIFPVSSDMNPGETREEYIARKRKEAAESQEMGMKGFERLLRSVFPESKLRKALYSDTTPPVEPGTEGYSHESLVGLRSKPEPPAAAVAAALPPAPAPAQPRANRPDTGIAAVAPAPTAPPAKSDKLSQIEEEYEAANRGLQALLGRQAQVDPELARLRQAAYESAQGIAERRERDRLAALEAAQKATGTPLLENQEALLRMAASLGGAKRFGEALSRAAGAAGEVRGEQRKALEAAQKVSREEQNAIDQLNQALAEKRVADRSGDVDRQRQAEIAVEQAKANLADKRLGVQKERGTEEDRAAQRDLQRRQIEATLQAARIQAAAREGATTLAEQRQAIQAMRADPNYASVVKELTEAKKLAAISNSPTMQARLRAAEKAARDLATAYGVTPGMMGMGSGAESSAPAPAAAPSGWGKATEVK